MLVHIHIYIYIHTFIYIRVVPMDLDIYKSIQYVVLSREFVGYACYGSETRRILLYLANVKVSDELLLATLIQTVKISGLIYTIIDIYICIYVYIYIYVYIHIYIYIHTNIHSYA
jgi:hypothetical protein